MMSDLDTDLLKQLVPLRELNSAERQHISRLVKVENLNQSNALSAEDYKDHFVYLLKGQVELSSEGSEKYSIDSTSTISLKPLFTPDSNITGLICLSDCQLALLEREAYNDLLEAGNETDGTQILPDINRIGKSVYQQIEQAIQSDQLKMPSLPEIAIKVQSAINKDDVDVKDIARIAESDPAIVVRLIQVANSPLTRGIEPVQSIHDAIVRLGLATTQNLIISFSMKQLFQSEQKVLKVRMQEMYENSVDISAISFALSKKLKTFDPDRLLLAGLVHDIGVIPILAYLETSGYEIHSEKEVDTVLAKLRTTVGSLVLKSWGFPDEMVNVAEQSENWFKSTEGNIDLADIVIVSQIYNLLRHKKLDTLPNINKIPVFKKMFPEEPSPTFVLEVLNDAQNIIEEMKQILSN